MGVVGDLWPRSEEEEGQEEPDWLQSEREQFEGYRDKNKDGKMDKEEVKHWIIPDDYDHSGAEAKHLIFEADGDQVVKICIISYSHLQGCLFLFFLFFSFFSLHGLIEWYFKRYMLIFKLLS